MNEELLKHQLNHTIRETHFSDLGERYQGKVRDTYRKDDRLVIITTDRISAFDHILKQTIPFKGQVLNQLAAFFFKATRDIVPNHILSVPDPNVTIAKHCKPFPLEFVMRGYLAGHAWREYKAGKRELCGQPLPDGLRQNSALPEPILTPATKAEEGHDEDISREDAIRRRIIHADTFDELEKYAKQLFKRGTELAAKQGLILVDTKYEFGRDKNDILTLIDEVHTPDSSRYFYADTYSDLLRDNQPQRQLSKEFVREWLMTNGFMGKEGQRLPDLPDSFRIEIARRYIELYESVTGITFQPESSLDPIARVKRVIYMLQ
ncbi:MAG TPA: phosphoribosylaminoimidazolesuccinocarboxamide synthase [Rhodothermales bacterium]|nr:phosphoribosylaminoimidazolesuccinocarboxamide synthase [Rhodothermales bacterium]